MRALTNPYHKSKFHVSTKCRRKKLPNIPFCQALGQAMKLKGGIPAATVGNLGGRSVSLLHSTTFDPTEICRQAAWAQCRRRRPRRRTPAARGGRHRSPRRPSVLVGLPSAGSVSETPPCGDIFLGPTSVRSPGSVYAKGCPSDCLCGPGCQVLWICSVCTNLFIGQLDMEHTR